MPGTAPTFCALRQGGRFDFGACQRWFCAEWVRRITTPDAAPPGIGAARWTARFVAVVDLPTRPGDIEGEAD